MGRLTRKTYAQLSDEQQAVFDKITEGRQGVEDGHIGGPFDVWLLNPELAGRIVGVGNHFRFKLSVDRRYIELAILVTGHFWKAQFEWYAHEPMARQAGVPESVIQDIKSGNRPSFVDDADAATYELARELHHNRQVSDATFETAVEHFGEQGVAELVNLCGFYTMVSMTLNTFEVPLPDGAELPFD